MRYILLVLVFCVASCSADKEPAAEETEPSREQANSVVTIKPAIASRIGLTTATAGPVAVKRHVEGQGLVAALDTNVARVSARFPGPIRSVAVALGDPVTKGAPLARVESNLSLTNYVVLAPRAGVVTRIDAAVGALAGDAPLFEITDLSAVRVDVQLFGDSSVAVAAGTAALIHSLSNKGQPVAGIVSGISPTIDVESQGLTVQVKAENADLALRPGQAVRVAIESGDDTFEIGVPIDALQILDDETVVFIPAGSTYTAREIKLGRRSAGSVEIVSGLQAGEAVVVHGSYLLKAELAKSQFEDDDD